MEGSVLSFLKAEWKVSDTGSPTEPLVLAHLGHNFSVTEWLRSLTSDLNPDTTYVGLHLIYTSIVNVSQLSMFKYMYVFSEM